VLIVFVLQKFIGLGLLDLVELVADLAVRVIWECGYEIIYLIVLALEVF
jgi:hypothetical protein